MHASDARNSDATSRGLCVVALQADLAWEDAALNRSAFQRRIEALPRGIDLIVLPEMWSSGFSMAVDRVAEPVGGPSERAMLDWAAAHDALVCGSLSRRTAVDGPAVNEFVAAFPDGRTARYVKVHPFGLGGEAEVYAAGDGFTTFEWRGVRITPLICYDLRFAECFTARAGETDLFIVVANWPSARTAHWDALLTARAIESQAYVLGVNRVGEGGGLTYDGHSRLIDPLGTTLVDAPSGTDTTLQGEVLSTTVADVRRRLPFLRDRRPELY